MGKLICLPCCVIICLACLIDPGDGQWKRLKLNELKRDVYLLEKLTDNLEHEIEDYYDEKLPARHHAEPHIQSHHHHSKRKHKTRTKKPKTYTTAVPNLNTYDNKSSIIDETPIRSFLTESADVSKKVNISDLHWPKFEEILSMNRRKYDWKNDRWIKLNNVPNVETKKVEMHRSKHRFNYRRVRLNSGKAKGNVVIAVSAVR